MAERYAFAAEPAYFVRPAEDLISFLRPAAGTKVLDVGAGSGAIAAAALRFEPNAAVVACDLSVPMLLHGRSRIASVRSVAAEVTGLPFAAAAFEAATLGFVLSHLPNPVAALREVKRVLTSRGKIAVSSWGSSAATSAAGELWRHTSEQYIRAEELEQAVAAVVPSEAVLATGEGLLAVLLSADFTAVTVHKRDYLVELSTAAFVQSRLLAAPSRYMQHRLSPDHWDDFVKNVTQQLISHFGPSVDFLISANLSIASLAGDLP